MLTLFHIGPGVSNKHLIVLHEHYHKIVHVSKEKFQYYINTHYNSSDFVIIFNSAILYISVIMILINYNYDVKCLYTYLYYKVSNFQKFLHFFLPLS